MLFSATKDFFDASVFLGMNSADEEVRKACKSFFASRFSAVVMTSLDQVGQCDDVIWSYPRELQDAYYPFMDQLHSLMQIYRQQFTELEWGHAMSDRRLQQLAVGDRLLLAKVIEAGGCLYSVRPHLLRRADLPVRHPEHVPDLDFPAPLAGLYHTSLCLRIPMEKLQI